MKTILVAVDGSAPSLRGVEQAVPLAKALGAKLELTYVVPPVMLPPAVYAETIRAIEEANQKLAEDVLSKGLAIVTAQGGTADKLVLHGAPAEALADAAKAERVWGVVIGAKGHNVVSRVLLGSVADRLMHICEKPVLIVR